MRHRTMWIAAAGLLVLGALTGCATNYAATQTNDAGEPTLSASPPWATWPYTDPYAYPAYPGRPTFPPHSEGP